MIIYPDIEIQNGQSVNRTRGKEDDPEVYDISPLDAARKFLDAGAEYLHVIDIDAALRRGKENADILGQIIDLADVPVQIGGGINTRRDVEWWLNRGAARVVLGTVAVLDRLLIMDVCGRHPEQIVISITGKDGHAMIDGWRTRTSFPILDLCKSFEDTGAAAIIYTDLDRLEGGTAVGFASTVELATELNIPLISTGTIDSLDDVSSLALLPRVEGVIIGRAFFQNRIGIKESIELARNSRISPELADEGVAPKLDEISGIPVKHIDHVGIFVSDLERSVRFYETLGFTKEEDRGFEDGWPVVMRHHSGVAVHLLHQDTKDPGHTQIALEVASLSRTRSFMEYNDIEIWDSYDHGTKGALYIKDPDDNLIELDRYRPPL